MNLRLRSALLFGLIVTLLLSTAFIFIYLQSENFRKDDFELRLEQRALTTYRLLLEEHAIDSSLLQVIDRNMPNKLYDEKIIILDNNKTTLYSSSGQREINVTDELLKNIFLTCPLLKIAKKQVLKFSNLSFFLLNLTALTRLNVTY